MALIVIEPLGEVGDKKERWGYHLGVAYSIVLGDVYAKEVDGHFALYIDGINRYREKFFGIVDLDNPEEADKRMYDAMIEDLVTPVKIRLIDDKDEVEIDDRTKYSKFSD